MLIIYGMYRDYERQQKIDRMYLNQNLKDDYEQLVDNEALKLGTEFFLEILIYITLLVVSTFEIYKTYHAQNDRQQNINKTISVI
ncbi:unnamed protein product [Paramecium sonneborni]|uniref:Uncharacterized protein n=1 Tax=Paramecium sonneborni TaxID=65129 RepID=A0A8S1K3B3_9CILI|nr:unnamed protein product [Paramecium sonneborni]